MKKSCRNRKFAVLFLLVTSMLLIAGRSFADTNEDIKNSKATITGNQEKIKQLENRQSELKSEKTKLESEKADTAAYIETLDEKQLELTNSISELQKEIEETQSRIEETEKELSEAESMRDSQKKSMGKRIRYMYEFSQSDLIELLLQSDSLAELLNNVEYIQKVNQYDRDQLQEFKDLVAETDQKKQELESEKLLLEAQENTLSAELESVVELSAEKKEQILAFEKEINAANEQERQLSKDVANLNAAIKEEENKIAKIEEELRRKEEEARKKAKQQKKEYKTQSIGDLNLMWPVPSSARVTSYFGDRDAPIEGASTSHKGIDIGAANGEKVLAAENGTVVIATYFQSAGNYVMISHGGGIYTVYMHLDSIKVSEDDEVRRGSIIGYVGNTGYSTGPHLHFGIRINGEYVDPLNYVAP